MNQVIDLNLVFHAPLHQLDGDSFMTRDPHGHLCTVTGAKWQSHGRNFDGIDDDIACGNAAGALSIQGAYSITVWFKASVSQNGALVVKGLQSSNLVNYYLMLRNTDLLQARHANPAGDAYTNIEAPFTPDGSWHQAVITYDMTQLNLYLDGRVSATPVADTVIPYTSDQTMQIGRWQTSYNYQGLIGEVLIYNRRLNPTEIQRNYLSARWRYR